MRKPGDIALSVVFYTWLIGAPLLIGVGLVRRVAQLPEKLSVDEAVAYAATTDAYLTWGLVLNGILPVVVVILEVLMRRRRRLIVICTIGAALLYGVVGLAAVVSDAPLFGHWPTIEKP
jgi:hypothetical protein